jgi:hypothetical protein
LPNYAVVIVGICLMIVGAVGLLVGLFANHYVRHLMSQSMWLSIFGAVLFAGLALQAAADGFDVTR